MQLTRFDRNLSKEEITGPLSLTDAPRVDPRQASAGPPRGVPKPQAPLVSAPARPVTNAQVTGPLALSANPTPLERGGRPSFKSPYAGTPAAAVNNAVAAGPPELPKPAPQVTTPQAQAIPAVLSRFGRAVKAAYLGGGSSPAPAPTQAPTGAPTTTQPGAPIAVTDDRIPGGTFAGPPAPGTRAGNAYDAARTPAVTAPAVTRGPNGEVVYSDGTGGTKNNIAATMTPAQLAAIGANTDPSKMIASAAAAAPAAPAVQAPLARGGVQMVPTQEAQVARASMDRRADTNALFSGTGPQAQFVSRLLADADTRSKRELAGTIISGLQGGINADAAGKLQLAGENARGANVVPGIEAQQAGELARQQVAESGATQRALLQRGPAAAYQTGADGSLYLAQGTNLTPVTGPDGKPFKGAAQGSLSMKDRYTIAENRLSDLALTGATPEQVAAERAKVYAEMGLPTAGEGGQYQEGQTYENPAGERAVFRNGTWEPVK